MKLYDFAFSPNCRKVRAVAYELGIELEYVQVDLVRGAQKAPVFLAVNPNGRVPVLVDGDFVLWESNAIMRYLSGKRGGALVPATPQSQADMDRWLSWHLSHLGPPMRQVAFERIVKKLTGQGAPDETLIFEASRDFATLTAMLEAGLDGRDYLAGALSLADFGLAAHYSLATMCGLDLTSFPRARAWLERLLTRDSMKHALADAQAAIGQHAA
jgi:glutathione S-transferase